MGTAAAMVGFGFFALKNLSKSREHLEQYTKVTKDVIEKISSTSKDSTKKVDKDTLSKLFKAIEATPDQIKAGIKSTNWSEKEKEEFVQEVSR